MLDSILRWITIIMLFIREVYWFVAGRIAQKEKPGKTMHSFQSLGGWFVSFLLEVLIFAQLFSLVTIIPIRVDKLLIQVIGVCMCLLGIVVSIVARKQLGINWSHAADYQIKKGHQLITTGMYKYVRHPIYLGLALSWIGAEMVAGSYLFISFFALFVALYMQGKREEKIHLAHFGEKYKDYMKHTKMLIPWVL
jgi:protein-S-isoprenylcysteine O-methyltransferase Ste14